MADIIKQESRPHAIGVDDRPKLGEWYWIKVRVDEPQGWSSYGRKTRKHYKKDAKPEFHEELLCVSEIGSNYVEFSIPVDEGHHICETIHNNELYERIVRPEPNWRTVLNQRVAEKQKQLQAAVKALADVCKFADLLPQENSQEPPSLLPTTTRRDPKLIKRRLLQVQKHKYPKAKENVEQITKELVSLHEAMVLPEHAKFNQMKGAMDEIDNRLFALHLYGGFNEMIKQIGDGAPAEQETPITVRQMLRYMDEETLFDYDKGGMDFEKLHDFDAWVAKPENIDRIAPEARCVVAFRVRRDHKQYQMPDTFGGWFELEAKFKANMKTYLLIRNGQNVFRIASEVDFSPRLIPYRAEFHKPLVRKVSGWGDKPDEEKVVTPADLEYDKHMKERKDQVRHYNRVVFLLQGLLDRSKVFSPHPPINLSDAEQVAKYLVLKYDEEDGLPSANPPVWNEYRDRLNAKIRVGQEVWGTYEYEVRINYEHRTRRASGVYKVTRIKKDRSEVRISWPWGTRWGYEHKWQGGGYYGHYGEWPVDKLRHAWVKMEDAFNIVDYTPGDYKKFLCDAYLKGAYLRWAPPLLSAEKWHIERKKTQNSNDSK